MEAGWWRDDVDAAISVKRIKYKNYKTLKKTGPIYLVEEASELYNIAKRNAKHLVWLAKSDSAKRQTEMRSTVLLNRSNQDVVGEKCVLNDAGELSLSDEEKTKAWTEHYSKLLNIEFDCPSDDLVFGPPPPITIEMIQKHYKR